jgi:hypothetical protein
MSIYISRGGRPIPGYTERLGVRDGLEFKGNYQVYIFMKN